MVSEARFLSEGERTIVDAYALDETVTREFLSLGFSVDDVPELVDAGATPEFVKSLVELGFSDKTHVIYLVGKGKSVLDVLSAFRAQGVESPYVLHSLVDYGIIPKETAPFTSLGIVHFLDDLVRFRVSLEQAAAYREIGIDQAGVIVELSGRGVTPRMLKEYIEAEGCVPPTMQDVVRFVEKGIGPEVVSVYRARGIPSYQIIDAVQEGVRPEQLVMYINAGFDPKKINLVRMIAKGVSVERLLAYRAAGVRESLIDDFIDEDIEPIPAGEYARVGICLPFEVQALMDSNITPECVREWRDAGVNIDSVHRLKSSSVNVERAKVFVAHGITSLFDIVVCCEGNIAPEIAVQYKTSFGDVHVNVVDFVKYGVPAEEFRAWEATLDRPEAVYRRDDAREELIVRRRWLPVLKRDFFIDERTVKRYSFEVLEQLYKLSMKGRDVCKPVTLVLRPKSDWNGAFGQKLVRDDFLHQATQHANVVIYEVDRASSVPERVMQCAERYGCISTLLLAGHGSRNSVKFGYGKDGQFTMASMKPLRNIDECLAPDASIILQSCETGQRRGIAQRLCARLGKKVYAPVSPSQLQKIAWDDSGRVAWVQYTTESAVYVPGRLAHVRRAVARAVAWLAS